jgi:hypothetical protein
VDVSALHLHQSLKVSDIVPPEGVKLMADPATLVVVISLPHKEEEVVKPVEEAVAAEPTEPEVIKKERVVKEEEEGKEKKGKEKE